MLCRLSMIAAMISAFAAALPAAGTRAEAADCPPSAIVEGPAAIARPIATLLRRHGVEPGPSRCGNPQVRAVLSEGAGAGATAYVLRIEDKFGRSNDREVSSAETAASLIESWVLEEDADLIAPRPGPAPAEAAVRATAAPPVPARASPFLMGAAEISAASDGSTWYGGNATGCMAVGAFCLGGRVRFGRTAATADALLGAELTRSAIAASAVAVLPLGHGRFSVAPTLGLGAAWAHTVLAVDPLAVSADDVVLRGEGAIIARLAIAGGWSLLAEIGGELGPVLSSDTRQGAMGLPVPVQVPLPLPPSATVHGGIGIGFSP